MGIAGADVHELGIRGPSVRHAGSGVRAAAGIVEANECPNAQKTTLSGRNDTPQSGRSRCPAGAAVQSDKGAAGGGADHAVVFRGVSVFECPSDPVENVYWRTLCRDRAGTDRAFREAFTQACFDDPLFFFEAALWVYEPRAKIKQKPFVLWPHQAPVILAMDATLDEAMENERPISLTVPKSRAQGATYIYLGVFIRRALRDAGFAAGLVTRNAEMVDSRTDADAVMYKLCWMLDRLPKWMLPEGYARNSTEHTVALPNGSIFSGYAATGDVARGGRKTAFAFDEPGSEEFVAANKDYKIMSSVGSVSNCTFLISTFGVDSGVFYESAMDPDNRRIVKLDWKDNPVHAKHAYVIRDGEPTAVHPEDASAVKEYIASHTRELKSIERRGHKMEGKVRSPWYDAHCLLPGGTPRFIARELDMDARGAVGKLFDMDLLESVKQRDCRKPLWRGKPVFDSETLKLTGLMTQANGPLKLWFKPGADNSPPLGPFSVGCDIAMGSDGAYSSNSVASIIDDRTGEQVGEYTIMGMQSIVFARNVLGLCMWLRNARLGWEDSGVSGPFAKEIMEARCYGNVYYREVAEIGSRRKTRKAGWRNGKDEDKADLFEKLALAMETGRFTVRSEDLIRECGEYEWEKGKIVHRPTKSGDQSEKAHGDRVIAGGVAWLVYSEDSTANRIDTSVETGDIPEYGSFLWREQRERRLLDSDSPDYCIRDVMLT